MNEREERREEREERRKERGEMGPRRRFIEIQYIGSNKVSV
jgi:hypothetical protein